MNFSFERRIPRFIFLSIKYTSILGFIPRKKSERIIRALIYHINGFDWKVGYSQNRAYRHKTILKSIHPACEYCGAKDRLTVDHIIPLSKGGADTLLNKQILCLRCNLRKSDSLVIQYGNEKLRRGETKLEALKRHQSRVPRSQEKGEVELSTGDVG